MFLKIRKDICSTFKFWGIIMSLIIQRGVFRPRLKDLIQMNTPRVVIQESKKAFRAIFKRNDLEAAMGALSNLKGVGPAMASGRPFQPLSVDEAKLKQRERKTRVLWKPLWSGWNCVWCVVFCTRALASNKLNTSRDFKLCAPLQRGKFYPQLTNLVRINTPRAVQTESKKAFRKLPNLDAAITTLCGLKGVGCTLASGWRPACLELKTRMHCRCLRLLIWTNQEMYERVFACFLDAEILSSVPT